MHFWGVLLDEPPCQSRVVEPPSEVNVKMFVTEDLESKDTFRGFAEESDPTERDMSI